MYEIRLHAIFGYCITALQSQNDLDVALEISVIQPEYDSNPAKVKLTKKGYWTFPAFDKLHEFVKGKTCIVPRFAVGRLNYGKVYFLESVDIYGMDLDEIGMHKIHDLI